MMRPSRLLDISTFGRYSRPIICGTAINRLCHNTIMPLPPGLICPDNPSPTSLCQRIVLPSKVKYIPEISPRILLRILNFKAVLIMGNDSVLPAWPDKHVFLIVSCCSYLPHSAYINPVIFHLASSWPASVKYEIHIIRDIMHCFHVVLCA